MRNDYIILLVCISFLCGCTQNKDFDPNFKGDVASMVTSIYNAVEKFGEIEKDELECVIKAEWDKDNNIVKLETYDGDGDIEHVYLYEYNENMLHVKTTTYDSDRNIEEMTKNIYNEKKQIKQTISYDSKGEEIYRNDITYDGKFKKMSQSRSIKPRYELDYGSLKVKYDTINYREEYSNDNKDIIEIKRFFNDTLWQTAKRICKKDSSTVQIETEGETPEIKYFEFNKHKLVTKVTFSDGKISEVVYDKMWCPVSITNAYYPTYGDWTLAGDPEDFILGGDQNVIIKYKYDNSDNWTKKEVRIQEKDEEDELYVIERIIQYQ